MTGVLPVGLERSTRIMPVVVHSTKEYVCVMELHSSLPIERVVDIIGRFRGTIYQRPPLKSSVKRALRKRTIHNIEVLEARERHVLLRIISDPGTYMRKLCHDIGILAEVGAHMRELRRTRTGPFKEEHAVTLHELSEAVYLWRECGEDSLLRKYILPVETAVCELPKAVLKDTSVSSVLHGSELYPSGILAFTEDVGKQRYIALFTTRGELVGLAKPFGDSAVWEKSVQEKTGKPLAKPVVNIMDRHAYPKMWMSRGKAG